MVSTEGRAGVDDSNIDTAPMDENEVAERLAIWLARSGWTIESTTAPGQAGDDIVATRDGNRLAIEAKGDTSSRTGTKRRGERFSRSAQIGNLGRAIVCAMQQANRADVTGIAFPDAPAVRALLDEIAPSLWAGGITVFIVGRDAVEERSGGRWKR